MVNINELPHVLTLEDIETNFKVYAGPGAGKTTWLISHLERILKNSSRLGKTGRIACITYTNVAADEINNRLKCDKNRFDISTIHSFLYRNVVKPFSYLIARDNNAQELFNVKKLDGHEEHIVQGDRYRRWVQTISDLNKRNYNILHSTKVKLLVIGELSSIDFAFTNEGSIDLITRQRRGAPIPRNNGELWIYKSKYWRDGTMHHEDVLYFSYLIFQRSPRVVEFLRNKFPYIFIDEFQDTTKLQTWIIDKIAENKTKVGLVGDLAQSIYKFTGAQRSDFINFKKGNIGEFKLYHNYRSTKRIIDFLNLLRPDINQEYGEDTVDGNNLTVLIGAIQAAQDWFAQNFPERDLYILTRKNISVSEINNQIGTVNDDLLKELYSNDSNSQRARLIHSILMGYRFHLKGDLKNSLKETINPLKRASGKKVLKLDLRKIAINIIDSLKDDNNRDKTVMNFYSELRQEIFDGYSFNIGSSFRTGSAKTFYESHKINDILPHIKVDTKSEDKVRTIHSAKGTEFENTLVHFESVADFRNYILNGANNIDSKDDDCRIYYVGCSRAKENLIINIPKASQKDLNSIVAMNLEYEII